MSEFRVVNNSFGSEYGRALGGIVNVVTKSGTNDLHGSIYDYLQNSAADSRSILQPRPALFLLRQNQFGGTLGGPISIYIHKSWQILAAELADLKEQPRWRARG